MNRFHLTLEAADDLNEIYDYIARDNPEAADAQLVIDSGGVGLIWFLCIPGIRFRAAPPETASMISGVEP